MDKNMKQVKIIFVGLISVMCLNANAHSSLHKLSTLYTIGGTYDTMSQRPTSHSSCLRDGGDQSRWVIKNPHAILDFSQVQSLQIVERALGVELSETINAGPFSVSDAYSYGSASQNTDYSLNINYAYQYAGTAEFNDNNLIEGEDSLTKEAEDLLHKSPTEFRQMCGDGFVANLDAGASVLFHLTLKFDSAIEKNYYTDSFERVGGLESILAKIVANPNNVHYHLTASGIQLGGNPSLLENVFIHNGGSVGDDGYPVLDCGTGGNNNCVQLINDLLHYVIEVPQQMQTASDYFLSNPVVSKWNSVGIYPGETDVNPSTLNAMQQITHQYYEDAGNLSLLNDYQNMLSVKGVMSSGMAQDLSDNISRYNRIMYMYHNSQMHLMDCFNGYVSTSCQLIRDNIFAERIRLLNKYDYLVEYIKLNQYYIDLPISKDRVARCGIYPLSEEVNGLYFVNCNGQISSDMDDGKDLKVKIFRDKINTMSIRNLNYSYKMGDGSINTFSYQINTPLINNALDQHLFLGEFLVNALYNGVSSQFINKLMVLQLR